MKSKDVPDYDVIIIGAGPAGAMLACQIMKLSATLSLKQLQSATGTNGEVIVHAPVALSTLIVENHVGKDYDAYHRKCGEGISNKTMSIISEHVVVVHELKSAVEHWAGTPDHEFVAPGFIIDRPSTLGNMTIDFSSIGGKVMHDSFLSARVEPDNLVHVKMTSGDVKTCRLLVGADGPNSRVRKSCGFGDARLTTLVQHVVHCDDPTTATEIWYDQKYKGGYKYKFPSGNGNVKIGFIHDTDSHDGESTLMQAKPVAWGGLYTYYKDGIVLIGDAAAQCNPITGGGMRAAFVAAKKLATMLVYGAIGKGRDEKTATLRSIAAKFSRWWKKTPYESRKYVKAHLAFKHMTNDDLVSFSEPIRENPVSILKKLKWWWLYRAFFNADKYSW